MSKKDFVKLSEAELLEKIEQFEKRELSLNAGAFALCSLG